MVAFQTGHAYHVLEDESCWDITDRGSKSTVERRKQLRFTQNEVITLLDWALGDGTGTTTYSCGRPVEDFKLDNKRFRLILLERFYGRGDELEFVLKRSGKDKFPNTTERIGIEATTVIAILKMSVRWPTDRAPRTVRLRKKNAAGQYDTKDVTTDVKTEGGRKHYELELPEPERGGETTIEWDW
jgi:hypothetical protein